MIEETAEVTKILQGQVWIKSLENGACGGCMKQGACGTATLSKLLPKREFAVDSELRLNVGDHVLVAIDDSHLLFSSVLLYLCPLLVMLAGVAFAMAFLPTSISEAWLPVVSLGFLLFSFWLLYLLQPVLLLHFCFRPQIVSKL